MAFELAFLKGREKRLWKERIAGVEALFWEETWHSLIT